MSLPEDPTNADKSESIAHRFKHEDTGSDPRTYTEKCKSGRDKWVAPVALELRHEDC